MQRKNTNINIRLTSALKTNIERHAKKQGLTIARRIAKSKADLRPAELTEMMSQTNTLKRINKALQGVYNNIEEVSLSGKSSEFRMSVAVAKNTGFSEIQKLEAMATTLGVLTERTPKNVTERIARINKKA
jgi:hypothetical protein